MPALATSKRSPAKWRTRPSAIWLRAEFLVQTNSARCGAIGKAAWRGLDLAGDGRLIPEEVEIGGTAC
jgi:hypothetical protein